MSDTTRIPLRGTIRGLRFISRPRVSVRCTAEPIGNALGVDAQTQAAGDLMCLQPAGMFDAARGCFVCDEHGGVLTPEGRDVARRLAHDPSYDLPEGLAPGARFQAMLARMETATPNAMFDALTHQARVSLQLAVQLSEN